MQVQITRSANNVELRVIWTCKNVSNAKLCLENSHQNVFLIQIDTSSFAEFEISEFEYRESTVYMYFIEISTVGVLENGINAAGRVIYSSYYMFFNCSFCIKNVEIKIRLTELVKVRYNENKYSVVEQWSIGNSQGSEVIVQILDLLGNKISLNSHLLGNWLLSKYI